MQSQNVTENANTNMIMNRNTNTNTICNPKHDLQSKIGSTIPTACLHNPKIQIQIQLGIQIQIQTQIQTKIQTQTQILIHQHQI